MTAVSIAPLAIARETVAVVGLGYVGLPLALALGRHGPTIGFDINARLTTACREGRDPTGEVSTKDFADTTVSFSSDDDVLEAATVYIVAVPTPIDRTRRPDLAALNSATELVGRYLRKGDLVIFESTVFPGATEEICGPALERVSRLKMGRDFALGYSPERINPGDASHSLASVVKVISGQDAPALDRVAAIYESVVEAGLFRAKTIRVAEASKVLENTQRDLNIALMNELALIFARAGIDTHAVIDAAATKWNFATYRPGLVGGHCIGVDPYYLTHLAETLGYHPDVILAGRRVNDAMGRFVGQAIIKELIALGKNITQSRVAILGVTFKENVADTRNSRVLEVVQELREHGVEVVLCDPNADPAQVEAVFGARLSRLETLQNLDGIVLTVKHHEFEAQRPRQLRELCRDRPLLADVRAVHRQDDAEAAGFRYWRL